MAKFDISKFSTLDKVLGGAAALAVISLFLPWYSVSYHGVTYDSTSGFGTSWGWLGGLLIIAAGVYLVLQRSGVDLSKMPAPPSVIILGAAALGTLVMILRAITLPSYFGVTAGPAAGMPNRFAQFQNSSAPFESTSACRSHAFNTAAASFARGVPY